MMSELVGGWKGFPVAGFSLPMTVAGVNASLAMSGKGAMTASLSNRPGNLCTTLQVRPPATSSNSASSQPVYPHAV